MDCHQCASKDGGCRDPYDVDDNADNSGECGELDTHCFKHKIVLKLYDSGAILGRARGMSLMLLYIAQLTLCMLGNFACFFCRLDFFKKK